MSQYSHLYARIAVRRPTGVLLYGRSGTGKSLLALATVAECPSANVIHVRGPELLSKYIGQSEANVRDVFERWVICR